MDRKTFWWPRPAGQQPKPPPAEDPLAQEDDDTRIMIGHYLHLAERLLSAQPHQWEDDEDVA